MWPRTRPRGVSRTAHPGVDCASVRHAAFLAAGLLATAAQVLLLRELVVDVAGDEAAIGVGLAAWLGGIAAGASAARRRRAAAAPRDAAAGLALLALLSPLGILGGRLLRLALAPRGGRAARPRPRPGPLARDAGAAGRGGGLDVHRPRRLGLPAVGGRRGHRAALRRRVARLAPRRRGGDRSSPARGCRPCASARSSASPPPCSPSPPGAAGSWPARWLLGGVGGRLPGRRRRSRRPSTPAPSARASRARPPACRCGPSPTRPTSTSPSAGTTCSTSTRAGSTRAASPTRTAPRASATSSRCSSRGRGASCSSGASSAASCRCCSSTRSSG